MNARPDIPHDGAEPSARSVREVARLTGLSGWTLRYYEKIGLIGPVARDPSSGHRVYAPRDLERIESLSHLRAIGLSIDQMRTMMNARGHTPQTIETKILLLTEHRAQIAREMDRLAARQRYIDNRVAYWNAVRANDTATAERLAEEGDQLSRELS